MKPLYKKILYLSCFGLSVLILIAVETAGFLNTQKQAEDRSLTKQTHIALRSTDRLLSKLTEAETEARGYLLTGDTNFAITYDKAIVEVKNEFEVLKGLTSNNTVHQKRLDILKILINIRLSLFDILNEFGNTRVLISAKTPVRIGKTVQDNIKSVISAMNEDESSVLVSRIKNEEKSTAYMNFTSIAGSVTSIVILIILAGFLYTESRKRLKYEQELLETKNFLALTLNSIGEAVISTDKLSNIIYMNSTAEKFLGWNFEEAKTKKFNEVVHVIDSCTNTRIENLISRVLEEKNIPWENSKIIINRAGSNYHIDNSAAAITDEKGISQGAVLVLRDISEHKAAQDKIDESQALASSTLNSLTAYIALLDEKGVINSVNKSWSAFALLNEDIKQLHPGINYVEVCEGLTSENSDEAKKFAAGIRNVLNGEVSEFLAEFPFHSYSGLRWFKGKAAKFIGGGNNKAVITLEDVTYKKESENEIRKSEEKFRSMVQNSSDIISIINKDGKILYVSPSSKNILGYERSSRLGKNIFHFVHPEDLPKVKASFNLLLKSPGSVHLEELRYKDAEGKFTILEIVFNNLLNDPNVQAIVLNSRNITDRKKAEERLVNALNEKEILLKEIHHRVKNNLQIIASLLKLQSNHFSNVKLKAAFEESISRVRSMSLVHQKLYQTDNAVSVSFNEYLNNFVSYLFQTYGAKSRIKANISSDNINMPVDDAIPCGLIINELVTNAFKYGFTDGRAGCITVGLTFDENAGEYHLIVGDDGIGMPAEMDIENNSTSFGFQLVSTLVQQMGGKIKIERDNGTIFKISLKSSNYKKRA